MANCLQCKKYIQCKDKAKSISYVCSMFSKDKSEQFAKFLEQTTVMPFNIGNRDFDSSMPVVVEGAHHSDFNAYEMVENIINDKRIVSPDIKFPESDFPAAKNFLEWCISDRFLYQTPFIAQAVIATVVFTEWCPECSDNDYLDNFKVNDSLTKFQKKICLLEHGVCPHCKKTKLQLFTKRLLKPYSELALAAGQRSGKSALLGMMSSYLTHRMLKLERPYEVYGLLKATVLQGTFVALTYAQAKDTLWDPYYGNLLDSPWFQQYHAALDEVQSRTGEEMYRLKDTFVYYRHRRIHVYPAGPDKRVLRGRCLTGSTMVNTSEGFLHFNEFIPKLGFTKSDISIDSHLGNVPVSHVYKDSSKTIKVETKNGFTIEGTPEHPLLVLQQNLNLEWIPLEDIKEGDWILSKTGNNTPIFGKSNLVSKELASILGYLTANGNGVYFSSDDSTVVEDLYEVYFKLTGKIPTHTPGVPGVRASNYYLKLGNKGEGRSFKREFLLPVGYNPKNSKDKEIPLSVRTSPKEILHEYLESYFSCDCGVNGGGSSRNSAPSEIEVGSASKKLATQLHVILFQVYNILGRLTRHVCTDGLNKETGEFNAKRLYWCITITGGDAYRFIKTFKRAKVQKYKDRFSNLAPGYGSDRRNIPYIRRFIFESFEEARIVSTSGQRLRRYSMEDGRTTCIAKSEKPSFINDLRGEDPELSYSPLPEFLLNDVLEKLDIIKSISTDRYNTLKGILDLNPHFEQVTTKRVLTKKKYVYDVTVPGSHAFTANCLTSHNTRFLASVDELGWFPNDKSADKNIKMNANEVYIALERSLLTVRASAKRAIKRGFYNVPFGYFLNISSPSSVRDKIMELVRASQHSPKIYGLAKPTWEMNPTVTYEDLAEEFKKDYNAAMRDYGAQPPLTNNPFIGNEDYLVKCFNKPNRLKLAVKYKKFPNGTQEVYSSLLDVPGGSKPSVLTLDAGHANNSFAFAIGHKNNAGMTVISVVGEVMAQSDAKISFSLVYKHLLSELTLLKNIVLVGADRWNSLKILSDMGEEFGIETKVYSLKYTDFNNFKSDLENRKIGLPKPKKSVTDILKYDQSKYPYCFRDTPEEHLVVQMLTVQDTGSGVIKGEQLTDDIFRATVLADALLNNPDFAHLFIGGSDEVEEQVATVNISQMMVSKNYSGGGAHSGSNASTNMVGVRATRKN